MIYNIIDIENTKQNIRLRNKMVKDYLEKIRQEYIEHKVSLEEQISLYENKVKENTKFLQVLEKETNPGYEAFSPREFNSFHKEKMEELRADQKRISNEIMCLRDQMQEYEFRIADITSVIKEETEIERKIHEAADIDSYDTRLALLRSVETERQRIARELHDSTTQNLTAIVHKTELCSKIIESDPVKCKLELFSIGQTLRKIIEDTRGLIYDLRPMSFDDIGFDVTVERALDRFQRFHRIECGYYTEGTSYPINSVVQITLLRVIQEACNNAVKHAQASYLEVKVSYLEKKIVLVIKDDGKGFDVHAVPDETRDDNSGFGLSMMKERVYLLTGTISIESAHGKACTIILSIPKNKAGLIKMAIKIMIADDHSMIREGLKSLLELEGDIQVVAEAEDGVDCLEKLKTCTPDVLLLDINMPRKNGLEVLQTLKSSKSKVKVLVLTVHNEVEYLMKAVDIGVDGYILKDSESAELKKAIFSIVEGENYIQPSLIPALNSKMIEKNRDEGKIESLTKRELEVLKLLAVGMYNKEVAEKLNISERTVKNHVSNIFKKIEVTDRTQAAVFAIRNNLIEL